MLRTLLVAMALASLSWTAPALSEHPVPRGVLGGVCPAALGTAAFEPPLDFERQQGVVVFDVAFGESPCLLGAAPCGPDPVAAPFCVGGLPAGCALVPYCAEGPGGEVDPWEYEGNCLLASFGNNSPVNVLAGGALGVWTQVFPPLHAREFSVVMLPDQACPTATATVLFLSYVTDFD